MYIIGEQKQLVAAARPIVDQINSLRDERDSVLEDLFRLERVRDKLEKQEYTPLEQVDREPSIEELKQLALDQVLSQRDAQSQMAFVEETRYCLHYITSTAYR
jgi:hypothetical protein